MKAYKLFNKILILILLINIAIFSIIPVNAVLKPEDLNSSSSNAETIQPILASVLQVISIIGSAASIIVLIILGIKYMVGSVEEKAEYKKTLLPYVIGAVLVFGATTIASAIYNMF